MDTTEIRRVEFWGHGSAQRHGWITTLYTKQALEGFDPRAQCFDDADHVPPVKGCSCGWYGVTDLGDLEWLTLMWTASLNDMARDGVVGWRLAAIRGELTHPTRGPLPRCSRSGAEMADRARQQVRRRGRADPFRTDPATTWRGREFHPDLAVVMTTPDERADAFHQMPGVDVVTVPIRGGQPGDVPLDERLWLHRQRGGVGNWWETSAPHADRCHRSLNRRTVGPWRIGTCRCGAHDATAR